MPAATAAPEPPLEPPGILSTFQGFLHGGFTVLFDLIPKANSCMLAFPIITAPALKRRSTTAAFWFGTCSLKKTDPDVVRTPAVSILSLTAIGIPCSSPNHLPSSIALSASSACRKASSAVTVIIELILSSFFEIDSKQVSTITRELFSCIRIILPSFSWF